MLKKTRKKKMEGNIAVILVTVLSKDENEDMSPCSPSDSPSNSAIMKVYVKRIPFHSNGFVLNHGE